MHVFIGLSILSSVVSVVFGIDTLRLEFGIVCLMCYHLIFASGRYKSIGGVCILYTMLNLIYYLFGIYLNTGSYALKIQISIFPSLLIPLFIYKKEDFNLNMCWYLVILGLALVDYIFHLSIAPKDGGLIFFLISLVFVSFIHSICGYIEAYLKLACLLLSSIIWFPDGRALLLYGFGSLLFIFIYNFRTLSFFIKNQFLIFVYVSLLIHFIIVNIDGDFLSSRVALYFDVISHISNRNSLLLGTTQGVGYFTDWLDTLIVFKNEVLDYKDDNLIKYGRFFSESMVLNVLHWRGLFGIVIFLTFVRYAYKQGAVGSKAGMLYLVFLLLVSLLDFSENNFMSCSAFWLSIYGSRYK